MTDGQAPGPSSRVRTLPYRHWPDALKVAWTAACTAPGFLESGGAVSTLSDGYRTNILRVGGRLLARLAAEGKAYSSVNDLLAAASHETLLRFAKAERAQGIKIGSLHTRLVSLLRFLEAMCPGWACPAATRRMILRVQSHARHEAVGERHIVHPAIMYQAALDGMHDGLTETGPPSDPQAWQSALMIALLTAAPVRIGNFSELRIGGNFIQRDGAWQIVLGKEETKTRRDDRWHLPQDLQPYIDHFLRTVRPCLLQHGTGPAHERLWVNACGMPLQHQGVRIRIKAFTAACFGKPILPHSFRHSAASAFAADHPDRPRDCAALLGHASARTTERHYVLGTRQLALGTLHEALAKIRGTASRPEAGQGG